MNQIILNTTTQNYNAACSDLMTMAERELNAFFVAVRESFGSEEANLSAEDWLQELESVHNLPASTIEWRRFSMNAATRLASRLNISSAVLV